MKNDASPATADTDAYVSISLSETQLRQIIDLVPHMIFVKDREGRYLLANAAKAAAHGLKVGQIIGRRQSDLCPDPSLVARMLADDQQIIATGKAKFIPEEPFVGADGDARVLETIKIPFEIPGRAGLFVLGVATDITERRRAEQALAQEERRHREVLDALEEGVSMIGADGVVYSCNPATARILGRSTDELIGRPWPQPAMRRITEDGQPFAQDEHPIAVTLATGRSFVNVVMGLVGPGDVVTWLSIDTRPRYREGEVRPYAVVVSLRDITQQKRAEQTMAKLSWALEHTADAIMITNVQGRIEYVNSGFETVTGYSREDVLGNSPRILQSGLMSAAFYRQMWQRILSGQVLNCVFTNRKKDGSLFYEDKTISPLWDDHGNITYFVSSARDVTDRTLAEQERLVREKAQRDLLVREVHHRIKNHLQGLTGLLHQHSTRYPEITRLLQTVISQIHSMAVVHGLQGETGHGQICLGNMTAAICTSITSLRSDGAAVLQLDRLVVGTVHVAHEEAVSLALVLNELITNALKHGGAESNDKPVQVALQAAADGVEVSVRNQGHALPAGFDFNTRRGIGTGLGLVHALLPRNGAQLVFSQQGRSVQARLVLRPPLVRLTDDPWWAPTSMEQTPAN